jgi:hypothetical protein
VLWFVSRYEGEMKFLRQRIADCSARVARGGALWRPQDRAWRGQDLHRRWVPSTQNEERRTKRMQRDAIDVSIVRGGRKAASFAESQQLASRAPLMRMPFCGRRLRV